MKSRMKMFAGLVMVAVILMAASGTALAAPGLQTTVTPPAPITGTIQTISLNTVGGVTTVDVTLLGIDGITYTVSYSLEEAISLNLVTLENNLPVVNSAMIGQELTFTPSVTPTPTPTVGVENPVGALIAAFFGLEYSAVEELHQSGNGFGEIAQACWMSYQLGGDGSLCGTILEAKKSGDYSKLPLPEGTSASNWGQFKKLVQQKGQNLGSIVSGRAASILTPTPVPSETPAPTTLSETGNGNGNGNNGNHGNGNNGNHGNGNGKGRGRK